jgi:hypothetical protein
MSRRRIDEQELIRRLSRAGGDVDLDAERILDLVDGRAGQPSGVGSRSRGRSLRMLRVPRRLLALPVVATVAAGVVGSQVLIASGQDRTVAHQPPWPAVASPATSALGGSQSITAGGNGGAGSGSRPSAGASRSGTTDGRSSSPGPSDTGRGSTTVTKVPGVTVVVSTLAAGSSRRLPLAGGATDTLVLAAGADGATAVHLPAGGSSLGPVQVTGSGQTVTPGPYQLDWTASSGTGRSGDWLTAPQAGDGSSAGLRIPVRTPRPSSTITLFGGTVGGGAELRVQVSLGGGGKLGITAKLPSCGSGVCPDLVTITLDPSLGGQGSPDVVVDLAATSPGVRVGLAAVELD